MSNSVVVPLVVVVEVVAVAVAVAVVVAVIAAVVAAFVVVVVVVVVIHLLLLYFKNIPMMLSVATLVVQVSWLTFNVYHNINV